MESEGVAETVPSAEGTARREGTTPTPGANTERRGRGGWRRRGPILWRRSWQRSSESRSDENRQRHRRGGASRLLRRVARRLGLSASRRWTSPVAYNTFRYGMVLLYLGTLFMVIGYHNNWVSFMKFLGLAMVILGILCVGSALGKSFSVMFEARNHGTSGRSQSQSTSRNRQNGNGYRTQSSQSKASLPNYEDAVNIDLPNYDEAESLRLNPKYLTENWLRRYSSVPFDPSASGSIAASTSTSLPNQGHISVIMIPEHPPPQYSELGELDTQFELSDASMEILQHQDNHPTRDHGTRPQSSIPRRPRGQEQSSQYVITTMTRAPTVYARPRTSHNFPTSGRRRSETRLASAIRPLTSRGTFPEDIPEVHLTTSGTISQQRRLQRSFSNLSLSSVEDMQHSSSPHVTTRPQTTMTIMVRSYSSSSFESDDASQCSTSDESSCWDELQRGGSGEDVEARGQENGQSGPTPEQVQDLQMEDLDEEHAN